MSPARPEPLFDPVTTVPKRCKACDTTRKNLCRYDADREAGMPQGRRPRSCLNTAQTNVIPY